MIEALPPLQPYSAAGAYLARLSELLAGVPEEAVDEVVEVLLRARTRGSRVYIMGNGGSAATSAHLATDLMKTSQVAGLRPLRAFSLAESSSLITAWANDTAYEDVFSQYLSSVLDPDDVVIAISASGNSPNIVRGLEAAREYGAETIGLVGFDGGAAADLVDVTIHIRSFDYGLVEDAHMAVGHAVSLAMRCALENN